MKIITFTKNNQFQALLQFSDPVNAQQAKLVRHDYLELNWSRKAFFDDPPILKVIVL